jgi:2-polyprenyl-6-methoxyphenol hydroxylase-like FAD-dependent oxidoreductase
MLAKMSQLVIIGAGPTGLTLALMLAQRGIAVKLIEVSRSFRRTFRGEALMPSGLGAIEQMGLSNLIAAIPRRPLAAWKFIIENRCIFQVDEPLEGGGEPCTLISQPAFLEGVLALAQDCPSFELIQGSAVRDLLWQDGRVAGVILGDNREIAADLVIGADGRNSIVRQRANLALEQDLSSFNILWFKLASSPQFEAENAFYSIVRGDDAFGVFCGSEGNLQIGWSLDRDSSDNWQQIDWVEKLATASPQWLATHIRGQSLSRGESQAEKIDRPILLSVTVGRCPSWHAPGVLLLGDAAHPMSPIRAQGINMALRDVIIGVNYLAPALSKNPDLAEIDALLPQIQAEREPEIIQIQRLQKAEIAQAELLKNYPPLRHSVSFLASKIPFISNRIRHSWLDRQFQLRGGVTKVFLTV